MQGFYAIYYTGKSGSGHMSLLLLRGQVHGLEAAGGILTGSYQENADGAVGLDLRFRFAKGTELVTGQTLQEDLEVPFKINVLRETFGGQPQRADMPLGSVNFRIEKITDI
jgi:hypothetical protein